MYFPPFLLQNNDIIEQLMQLETMSYHEQLRIVRNLLCNQLDQKTLELVNRIKRRIENNIMVEHEREISLRKLESENQDLKSEMYDHKHRLSSYEDEIRRLRERLTASEIDLNLMISSSPKGYRNLFIYLFAHPKNHSNATKEILSRINYLDKMTRDVHFTMPGYEQAEAGDDVVNEQDKNMKLKFDENVFLSYIQELEDKSNGKFSYQDDCELVFVGQKKNGEFDIDSLTRIDLDYISKDKSIDPVKLIIAVSQAFRKEKSEKLDTQTLVTHVIGELCVEKPKSILRIFIAGAKKTKT